MNKPSHGQMRGYLVLCFILIVALLLTILWPLSVKEPSPSDNSQLARVVDSYGDEIIAHGRHAGSKPSGRSDSSRSFVFDKRNGHSPSKPYDTLKVNVNTADTSRLQLLRGIGPVFARRIVKYRTRLGGFVSADQLLEVYGMDSVRLSEIRPHVIVSPQDVRRIHVNSASLDELRQHPYLDYYQARAIVDFRLSVGPLHSADDLLKINLIDQTTATKISQYIQYD